METVKASTKTLIILTIQTALNFNTKNSKFQYHLGKFHTLNFNTTNGKHHTVNCIYQEEQYTKSCQSTSSVHHFLITKAAQEAPRNIFEKC